jgi:DNA invertase Pin-like site-specific DNA recombinase
MAKSKIFGYAKVNDSDPDAEIQIKRLSEYGVFTTYIHTDFTKGTRRGRFKDLLNRIQASDLLVITSIESLNEWSHFTNYKGGYHSVKSNWDGITKEIGADIKVLDIPLLDTTLYKETTGTHTAELLSQLLSYLAQKEDERFREEIKRSKARHRRGINRAKRNGRYIGRPKAKFPPNWREVHTKLIARKITAPEAIEELGLTRSTFYKLKKEYESIATKE